MDVAAAATLESTLTVTGITKLATDAGDTHVSGALCVGDGGRLNNRSTSNLEGAVTAGSTLSSVGQTNLATGGTEVQASGSLYIASGKRLVALGAGTVEGAFNTVGDTLLAQNSGDAQVSGNLIVKSNKKLIALGESKLEGLLNVDGAVDMDPTAYNVNYTGLGSNGPAVNVVGDVANDGSRNGFIGYFSGSGATMSSRPFLAIRAAIDVPHEGTLQVMGNSKIGFSQNKVNGAMSGSIAFDGISRMQLSSSSGWDISGSVNADYILALSPECNGAVATSWSTYSMRKLKKNIQGLADPIGLIKSLRGVSFDWRSNGKSDFGFIADEVDAVVPEIVGHTSNGNARSVDYSRFSPILVEAVKAQQEQIDLLQAKLDELAKK